MIEEVCPILTNNEIDEILYQKYIKYDNRFHLKSGKYKDIVLNSDMYKSLINQIEVRQQDLYRCVLSRLEDGETISQALSSISVEESIDREILLAIVVHYDKS